MATTHLHEAQLLEEVHAHAAVADAHLADVPGVLAQAQVELQAREVEEAVVHRVVHVEVEVHRRQPHALPHDVLVIHALQGVPARNQVLANDPVRANMEDLQGRGPCTQ